MANTNDELTLPNEYMIVKRDFEAIESVVEDIYSAHERANKRYNGYIPYKFHLKLASKHAKNYSYLLSLEEKRFFEELPQTYVGEVNSHIVLSTLIRRSVLIAVEGHDFLEDTHENYNDLKKILQRSLDWSDYYIRLTLEMIYAVTEFTGRNRSERAPDQYYINIRNTPGATFVKLCDRLANLEFGILTESRMLDTYRKEWPRVKELLELDQEHIYWPMVQRVEELLDPIKISM